MMIATTPLVDLSPYATNLQGYIGIAALLGSAVFGAIFGIRVIMRAFGAACGEGSDDDGYWASEGDMQAHYEAMYETDNHDTDYWSEGDGGTIDRMAGSGESSEHGPWDSEELT